MTTDANLPLGYLPCRSLLHAWNIVTFTRATEEDLAKVKTTRIGYSQVIVRVTDCMRCHTQRVEYFGRVNGRSLAPFAKFAQRYIYPSDYLFRGEGPRPARVEYTAALYERWYERMGEGGENE